MVGGGDILPGVTVAIHPSATVVTRIARTVRTGPRAKGKREGAEGGGGLSRGEVEGATAKHGGC